MSPAAPSAPRWIAPWTTRPLPTPVPTFSTSRSVTSGYTARHSPTAIALTSLSTTTGQLKRAPNQPGMSKRSHPVMIGGLITRPVAKSTGPGTSMPMPRTSPGPRPPADSSCAKWSDTRPSTGSGPSATSLRTSCSPRTAPLRSHTAIRIAVAPMSATSRTPRSRLNSNRPGGRPPVDWPTSAAASRPASTRASIRWLTVDRASPVRLITSALLSRESSRKTESTAERSVGCGRPITGVGLLSVQPACAGHCTTVMGLLMAVGRLKSASRVQKRPTLGVR